MVPYEELQRALARWKARKNGTEAPAEYAEEGYAVEEVIADGGGGSGLIHLTDADADDDTGYPR
jgi:hypothetical protein